MVEDKGQAQLEQLQRRIHELSARVEEKPAPAGPQAVTVEALEELATSLEELSVAQEELSAQNDELRNAHQAIEGERQRYQDLFDFAPDGYLVTDTDGAILEANQAAAALLRSPAGALHHKPLAVFVDSSNRPAFRQALIQVRRKNGARQQLQFTLTARNGERYDMDATLAPVRSSVGELIGLRWMLRDISERKRAEERVRASEARLAELNAALEQRVAERTAELENANEQLLAEAAERLRAQEVLRAHAAQQAAVAELGQLALTGMDAPALAEEAVKRVARTLQVEYAKLWELQPDGQSFVLRASVGEPAENIDHLTVPAGTHSQAGYTLMTNAPVVVEDLRSEQRFSVRPLVIEQGLSSGVSVVVHHRDRPFGVLAAHAIGRRPFSPADVAFMQSVANVVAAAIERRQTEDALQESEEQFRQLAENIDQVFWLRDPVTDRLLYISPACARVFGRPPQSLYEDSHSFVDVIHPDDRQRVIDTLPNQATGQFNEEYRVIHPDGSLHWVWARTFPVRNDTGKTPRYVGFAQDITARKEAEAALGVALERARELYQISRLIGLVHNPDDVLRALVLSNYFEHMNRADILLFDAPWQDAPPHGFRVIASWRGDEALPVILGREFELETYGFGTLFTRDQPVAIEDARQDPRLNNAARALFQDMGTRGLMLFPLIAAGQWFGMLSLHTGSPRAIRPEDLRHMRGLIDQAAVATYNIHLLETEAAARREAEHANNLKLQFLAMISHELRTPLTSIKGFATTLLADDVTWEPAAQRDFIVTINEEADKLTDMIEQLLDLSRLEAGQLRIRTGTHELSKIVERMAAQLKAITALHELRVNVPETLPPVKADVQRVTQVITNLVDNAVKYSPRGSRIAVSASARGDFVQVNVSDQGIGIPPAERGGVFEAFRRGEGDSTKRTKGAGLGLAICKGIIETHGGRIWLQESNGPGTTLSFTLPMATKP